MRIGVVTTSYPRFPQDPSGGFVAELTAHIARAGHEVEVVAAGGNQGDDSWQASLVSRVYADPGLFYEGGAPDALQERFVAWAAARFTARLAWTVARKAAHWDGIVAHWLAPCVLVAASVAPRLPLWGIAHGGDVHLLAKLGLAPAAARLLSRHSVHLNFVSNSLSRKFSECAGATGKSLVARSSIAPMGVDVGHFLKLPNRRAGNERPLLLFLGRLVPIKGVDLLLAALSKASEPNASQDWRIVVAGRGPSQASLIAQADSLGLEVEWPGQVVGAGLDDLLSRADLLVIPSRSYAGREEGMPTVALLAMAAGAQLLVSDSGGLGEIPESICHRFPSGNVGALRASLGTILDGGQADYKPGTWLRDRSWHALAPRILPGLI